METDVRHNPGLLKLDLYCRGIRLDDSCFIEKDGGRSIMRTRAGLGSGLEAVLPHGLWTNIPVVEDFAKSSPYLLFREGDRYVIRRESDRELIAPIKLSPRPQWYDKRTTSGKLMTKIGSLQGTYLGIYPSKVCEYWTEEPKMNCKFCSVGLNLGVDDADEKSVDEVMEVVWAAREESNITYLDFNTGHYTGHTFLDILEPYVKRIKAETGLLVGIQTPPHPDMSRFDRMRDIGVNRVSFCFEIWDPERFKEVCPGKDREYGLKGYLDAVEYCAKLGRRSRFSFEPWVSNGEIIAGLESPESSIKAIDWITSVGAIPTVCVFRPLRATDYENVPPPKTEDMVPVFRRQYEACMEQGLPIGVAPNIHVSLVMLPEEGRWLTDNPGKYRLKEMRLKALSKIYAARYYRTLNQHLKEHRKSRAAAPESLVGA
ncbi:MAG: radical SAM protein [Candidatus Eisenbacteria bacterium]|nr:radical SAM protein [Candidatus Eisenbacteria bacterium]